MTICDPAKLRKAVLDDTPGGDMTSVTRSVPSLTLVIVLALAGLLAAQSAPQKRHATNYQVFFFPDTLGGTASAANAINDLGWAMGSADLAGNTNLEAVAWIEGKTVKLGTLGGPNSSVAWESVKNNNGLIVGISDTSIVQPRGEVFSCVAGGFLPSSGNTCQGFLWQDGHISPLPTLGGDNGFATGVNNKGQVIGWAETSYEDPTCNLPQVLQFLPFVYNLKTAKISALQTYPGDSDGTVDAINDKGQMAGISGICSNAVGGASAIHAVFWQDQNSTPIDMGNLGGMAWNTPAGMNNKGEVVGFGNPSGDQNAGFNPIAFYWNESAGMKNLGTLAQDANSIAYAINKSGLIVGQSFGGPNGSHAFIYQDGIMTDLNSLMIGHNAFTLVYANDVNDNGVIVGGAFNSKTGEAPAFVAVPY
jgi:probable HAF family extracellular repeat protein